MPPHQSTSRLRHAIRKRVLLLSVFAARATPVKKGFFRGSFIRVSRTRNTNGTGFFNFFSCVFRLRDASEKRNFFRSSLSLALVSADQSYAECE